MNFQHIKLSYINDHQTLTVDDWELFDFLDDHFTDHGLEVEYISTKKLNNNQLYVMHFEKKIDSAQLNKILNLVSPEEVHRIWELNN